VPIEEKEEEEGTVLLHAPPGLTLKISTFCPHSVFMKL
jgi:hypothetical protein